MTNIGITTGHKEIADGFVNVVSSPLTYIGLLALNTGIKPAVDFLRHRTGRIDTSNINSDPISIGADPKEELMPMPVPPQDISPTTNYPE